MRISTIPSIPRMPSLVWRGDSGGGIDPDPDPEPGEFARTASTNSTMSIHSGHSLTDAYSHLGPFPGNLRSVLESAGYTDTYDKLIVSVIPGSSIQYRVENDNTLTEGHRAYSEIGQFHTLMITEAGPPPRMASEYMVNTLDYFCRFAANTIENGAGNEVVLWSIWPALNGPGTSVENPIPTGDWAGFTFRTGLDEYNKSFKYMADYATWKMKQLYPSLPSYWRVWLFPGDRWMARVYDDIQGGLVPGITDIADLFADDIHPSPLGGYGLACLVASCMYQVNLTDAENVWIMPGYTDASEQAWPAVSQALAEYFWQIAWEIATDYEPVGMGGSGGTDVEWQPSDGDPMPNWTLADPDTGGGGGSDPEPGDLPEFALTATADDTADLLAMTGTQPTIEDGVLKFAGGEALTSTIALTDRYVVMSVMIPDELPTDVVETLVGFRAADTPGWDASGPVFLSYNGWLQRFTAASAGQDVEISTLLEANVWAIVEMWTDGENVAGAFNGSELFSIAAVTPETIDVRLLPEGALACHIAALGVCDHVPDAGGMAAARAWAQAEIPE